MFGIKSEFTSNIQLQTFKTDNHHNSVTKYTHMNQILNYRKYIYIFQHYTLSGQPLYNQNISSLCNGILFCPSSSHFFLLHPNIYSCVYKKTLIFITSVIKG